MEDRNLRPNQTKYGGDDGRTTFVDDEEACVNMYSKEDKGVWCRAIGIGLARALG